jgi:hypothetical protein
VWVAVIVRAGAVHRNVRELVNALKENMENMRAQCEKLEADEKGLDAKVRA